ncbi:hypothetical protein Ddye_020229 [Dipteronia dyeriana]|uniref:Uncharacterized protein n=1 Tax=Dipteronia dyeriana TaxID=168575 RepID=A0AAD9U0C1_9ROSI|nr:hypothetical protein Ddye_020229 [Dipteronia dyeriana]
MSKMCSSSTLVGAGTMFRVIGEIVGTFWFDSSLSNKDPNTILVVNTQLNTSNTLGSKMKSNLFMCERLEEKKKQTSRFYFNFPIFFYYSELFYYFRVFL